MLLRIHYRVGRNPEGSRPGRVRAALQRRLGLDILLRPLLRRHYSPSVMVISGNPSRWWTPRSELGACEAAFQHASCRALSASQPVVFADEPLANSRRGGLRSGDHVVARVIE